MEKCEIDIAALVLAIKSWGRELGFQEIGITDPNLSAYEKDLAQHIEKGYHGTMDYMARHTCRTQPDELMPEIKSVIMARMNYLPPTTSAIETLNDPNLATISRYALGRDYHKLIRKRLQKLAKRIEEEFGEFVYRPFADSAPVFEKPFAEKSGLGWIGKNTLLLNRNAGSWFFLGTLYTSLPLPPDSPVQDHCGKCTACISICPTQAIVGPKKLNASRCISYLTIELRDAIPVELRPLIGNRIYGCDDCQLVCPWNRFARLTAEKDFHPRHDLDRAALIDLFAWSEEEFLSRTEGSAIRRIGHVGWLRNIAVALGNAPSSRATIDALNARANHSSSLVREHVSWALAQHKNFSR